MINIEKQYQEAPEKALLNLPLVRFVPCCAAGMLAEYFGGSIIGAVLFAAAVAAAIFWGIKRKKAMLCAAGSAVGILLMALHIYLYCDPILKHNGNTISGELLICEAVENRNGGTRYIAAANIKGRRAYISLSGERKFKTGDTLLAETELYETDPDYIQYDMASGVLLSGKIIHAELSSSGGLPIRRAFEALRRQIMGKTFCYVSGDEAELAASILFGEDSKLSPAASEALRISGAAHYTAVSGSHFALLAAIIMGLFPKNKRRLNSAAGIFAAIIGVLFFGASKSVLRAAIMLIINSAAGLFKRRSETLNSLCTAVLLLIFRQPSAILDTGFGMSILGVLGVSAVGGRISEKLSEFLPIPARPVIDIFSRSMCACICTSPISIALFKGCSAASALTTLLLAPLMAAGMMFATLTAVLNSPVTALPIEFSMKLSKMIIEQIGKHRSLWITLDFKAAWVLALTSAVLIVIMAFGDLRVFLPAGNLCMLTILISLTVSLVISQNRNEIRFVGNNQSCAAVVIHKTEAVVFVSGTGGGLSESISRCMREHGAYSISAMIQPEGNYAGLVSINELSKIVEIYSVYTKPIPGKVLQNTKPLNSGTYITLPEITIAPSKVPVEADIVLFSGRISEKVSSPAKTAVYFSSVDKQLPPNFQNAKRIKELCIKLTDEKPIISIAKSTDNKF